MQSFEYESFAQRLGISFGGLDKSLTVSSELAAIANPELYVFGDRICKLFPMFQNAAQFMKLRSVKRKLVSVNNEAQYLIYIQIAPPQPYLQDYDLWSVKQFVNDELVIDIRQLEFYYTIAIAPPDPGWVQLQSVNITQFKLKDPSQIQAKILPPSELVLQQDSNQVLSIVKAASSYSSANIAPPLLTLLLPENVDPLIVAVYEPMLYHQYPGKMNIAPPLSASHFSNITLSDIMHLLFNPFEEIKIPPPPHLVFMHQTN
ncbi:MAG: hypothetical protein EZS28_048271, partial [Streblomastix strix]